MNKIIAYIRTSTDKQDADNQKLQIYDYAQSNNLKIYSIIEIAVSSRKSDKDRRIGELTEILHDGDTLIVTELSRLGRSTAAVIALVNQLLDQNIRLVVLKQGLNLVKHDMSSKIVVTMFSLFAELERDMISQRTKDALANKKASGITLGKPKGTIQVSKFEQHKDKIAEFIDLGLPITKMARFLGYKSSGGLSLYIKTRLMNAQK